MPPLVIVCGPPAVGKTTLASALRKRLGLPVISKDALKEAMMDHLGAAPAVGATAFAVQFSVARELLESGVGLILEGPFFFVQTELADLARLGRTAILSLECPLELLERRYIERQGIRHPSHRGLEALPDLRERVRNGSYKPPELGRPLLRIDTSDGLRPTENDIVLWLSVQIGVDAQP